MECRRCIGFSWPLCIHACMHPFLVEGPMVCLRYVHACMRKGTAVLPAWSVVPLCMHGILLRAVRLVRSHRLACAQHCGASRGRSSLVYRQTTGSADGACRRMRLPWDGLGCSACHPADHDGCLHRPLQSSLLVHWLLAESVSAPRMHAPPLQVLRLRSPQRLPLRGGHEPQQAAERPRPVSLNAAVNATTKAQCLARVAQGSSKGSCCAAALYNLEVLTGDRPCARVHMCGPGQA